MNMSTSPIAIVIPVYNRENLVKATLASVAAQSFRPLHVVVVDNGSTDNTRPVISEWAEQNSTTDFEITILYEPVHSASAARNCGFQAVKSPYVMFFDSDDVMLPDHVERAMTAFVDDTTLDIVGWDISYRFADGRVRRLPFADCDMLFRHLFNSILSTQRYAMRSELLRRAGGWNPGLKVLNDYELGVRLLMLRPKAKRLDGEITVMTAVSPDSLTRPRISDNVAMCEQSLDCCAATLRRNGIGTEAIELRRTVLAAICSHEGAPRGKQLQREVLNRQPSLLTRIALRAAYHYTRLGGRGVHYLFRGWFTRHFQAPQP